MKLNAAIWKPYINPLTRHMLYVLGGGKRNYVDIGYKARACVDHDRKCAEIAKGRVSKNSCRELDA